MFDLLFSSLFILHFDPAIINEKVEMLSKNMENMENKLDKILSKLSNMDVRMTKCKINKDENNRSNIITYSKQMIRKEADQSVFQGDILPSLKKLSEAVDEVNTTVVTEALRTWSEKNQQGSHRWKKVFSHDTSGGVFNDLKDAMNKNPNDENTKLFSILDQLERYRDPEGNFHLKICYPEVTYTPIQPCNEWKQTSNPVFESNITGYKALKIAFHKTSTGGIFSGLARSSATTSTLIDETDSHSNWYFAVGALHFWHKADTIPGPVAETSDLSAVKKVELFVYIFE